MKRLTKPALILSYPLRSIMLHAGISIAYTAAFFLLSSPQVIFISRLGSVLWYPAIGVSFALMFGISPWYGFLVCLCDCLTGILFYHQPLYSYASTVGPVIGTAEYAIAAHILSKSLRIDRQLLRARDVVAYLSVAVFAAIAATVTGVTFLLADKSIRPQDFWLASIHWFIGDGVGLVGLAPALLIFVFPGLRRSLLPNRNDQGNRGRSNRAASGGWGLAERVAQSATLGLIIYVIFAPRWSRLDLFYLTFIPVLWVAMRGGVRLAAAATVILNFGIILAIHLFPPDAATLPRIGTLMLVVSATGLVVGSTVTERAFMGKQLHEKTAYLNALFEKSPLGVVILTREGRVELVNEAFTRLSLYQHDDLVGRDLDSVFLPAEDPQTSTWSQEVLKGESFHHTIRRRRRDGILLDIELHAVPLVIGGSFEGAYAICKDITEETRAANAERSHACSLSRMVTELALQTQQMTLLKEMASLLDCCATTAEACNVVGQFAGKFFRESISGTLFIFKASRNLVEASASWGAPQSSETVFAPQSCWALRRGQPHWGTTPGGISCAHVSSSRPANNLCLPMVGHGETLGALQIEFPLLSDEPSAVADARQTLGVTVASEIALSLGSIQLRETLRDQSIRDPLTGLFNRRFMQESLEREVMRSRRKNHPISLIYLDIDHFKRFNDSFGHDAGDYVLKTFADLLQGFFRGDDVTCRCGGEEFAVILPESLAKHAAIRAEELRLKVKQLVLHHKDRKLDPVSVSVGIACFPENGLSCEDLLRAADRCLYESKSLGRDRVTVA